MTKTIHALALSLAVTGGLAASAHAMTRAIPVHFVNIAELPSTKKVDVGDMLCIVQDRNTFATGTVVTVTSGRMQQSRMLDQRPGPLLTVACYDVGLDKREVTLGVKAKRLSDGSALDSKLEIKIE